MASRTERGERVRLLVAGVWLSVSSFAGAGEGAGRGTVGPYSVLPASLIERWNTGDCNVIWIGDSISSGEYQPVQSSVFVGMMEVHPNIAGFQQIYTATTAFSQAAHEIQYENTLNGPGASGMILANPGSLSNRSTGGVDGFLPVFGRSFSYEEDVADNTQMLNAALLDSPAIESPNWWAGEDVRLDWIYYRESASNPSQVRLSSHPGDAFVSSVDYSLSDTTVLSEDVGSTLGVFESVPGGDGLCMISQRANDAALNASGTTARMRFRTGSSGEDETGNELCFAMPFFQVENAVGFRAWGAGFGGWRTGDHARADGSGEGSFYSDDAITQFTACVGASGQALNTIVIALGANDALSFDNIELRENLVAIIDRWAVRMMAHTTDDIQVVIVAPYVFADNASGQRTPNRFQEAFNVLRASGTAEVDGLNIGVINLKRAMGDVWFEEFDPTWPASPGNVHPSPAGANGIAQMIQDAFEIVGAPCPADLFLDWRVDATDLAVLLSGWGGGGVGDLSGDGVIGAQDLAMMLAAWGECP